MGISLGGSKLGTIAEINVVPLMDILLVLLVTFMVMRPRIQVGLPVDLPEPIAVNTPAPPNVIVVQILGDGTLRINRQPVEWQYLQARLGEIFKIRASQVVFVRGDDAIEFGVIARVIDMMRASGITTVGLMTPELAIAH